ncbi:Uu.00g004660.m01.CDS01 [Anthostomella pinea]|uniref:Uu.00g004660.m01.CDS01 n=1 Tax=Anthostomella pinea TaxID=933095 RepID=A0AAI8VK02_9PEZI|nr:Uu.00g004660.m01.CDS01 [Anthostomella pinea]
MMQPAPSASPPASEQNDEPPSATSTRSLPILSPQIKIQPAIDMPMRPSLAPHVSAPPAAPKFQSPMRHHKRTPSQHREIKETLNAKTEYTNDEADGSSQHTINQYTIREEIGRGSYGAVHLATDQFGKEYAVKEFSKMRLRKRAQSNILRRPEGGRPGQLAPGRGRWNTHKKQLSHHDAEEAKDSLYLIREEIAIMKKLDHPNLVSLIEVLDDPDDDSLYMVLEMCKKGVIMNVGVDDKADPYDDQHCWMWFRDLVLGIEYLHAQGIVHRDIKPDNLLLTEDDVLKIVDFGVSEMFEKPDQMLTHKSAGSPAFLPPELCQAKHGDVSGKAADVWSMGVTLYCLKYGELPFPCDNVLDMYNAIRADELRLPSDENEEFADLITRLLDKNSDTRITMPEIRNHPWITRGGSDPLLSEEENCSDMVEAPNELEVNHAFTQKMDHMLYVLRAIQRFKGLALSSRVATSEGGSPRTTRHPPGLAEKEVIPENNELAQPSKPQLQSTTGRPRKKTNAEEAADLVDLRNAYHASSGRASRHTEPAIGTGEKGHTQDPTDKTPLFLGIGTGGRDDFASGEAPATIVSDSPTGIDFDIYDRAFETEIKRIRSDRKKGGRARTYLTRFVGEKEADKYLGDEHMVVEAGKSFASIAYARGSEAASQGIARVQEASNAATLQGNDIKEKLETKRQESQDGVKKAVEAAKETGNKFANLVTSMRK